MIQPFRDTQVYSERVTDDPTPVTTSDAKLPNRYAPPAGMRWGLWEVAIGLVVFVTLGAAFAVLARAVLPDDDFIGNLEPLGFASALLAYAGLMAVIVVASRRLGLRSLAADFGLRFRPIDLLIGLGIGVVGRIFTLVLTVVAISITGYSPEQGNFVLASEPLWIVLNGVVIAVLVAPLVEELFFRGLLLRAVRNRVLRWRGREQPADAATQKRAVILSIAISSIAFMALHMYQAVDDPTLAIILGGSTLFVGAANAVVALLTHRLGGAVVGHMVFNGSAVVLSLLVT